MQAYSGIIEISDGVNEAFIQMLDLFVAIMDEVIGLYTIILHEISLY